MGLFRRAATVDPAEVDRMKAELASMRDAMDHRLRALDDRVTSVSTELANQLNELGHDLDILVDHPTVDAEVLTAVREGQVKLANEQVRYQIAFREDLARLAQEVKRPQR